MPAEGRENPLLKKGNSDAFFREKYLTKNRMAVPPDTDVYLEAVETAKDPKEKTDRSGLTGMGSL